MYLVDTNVVSEARRGAPHAVNWLRSVDPLTVYLSVITLGEIMRGIALKQKADPRGAAPLAEWLQQLRHDHADRILAITDQIAVEWGRIAALRPRGDADGLIAATAIVHDLIIVTRNVLDFEDTRACVINPWDERANEREGPSPRPARAGGAAARASRNFGRLRPRLCQGCAVGEYAARL